MTVHRDKFLVNKTNRCNEVQFYWYYDSTCFGQPFCPSSGVLSRTSTLVYFTQFDDRLLPWAGWNCSSILFLVANGSSKLHKMCQCRCTAKNSWWRAERLPETCRVVIAIKLESSASVGFIRKEAENQFTSVPVSHPERADTWFCHLYRVQRWRMCGSVPSLPRPPRSSGVVLVCDHGRLLRDSRFS